MERVGEEGLDRVGEEDLDLERPGEEGGEEGADRVGEEALDLPGEADLDLPGELGGEAVSLLIERFGDDILAAVKPFQARIYLEIFLSFFGKNLSFV